MHMPTYDFTRSFSIAVGADVGKEAAPIGALWWGLSGYARYRCTRWLNMAARGEYLDDRNGYVTGTPQQVGELTTTLEVHRLVVARPWPRVPGVQTRISRGAAVFDALPTSTQGPFAGHAHPRSGRDVLG